jgi:predicted RNase H-like HicB family nuclease
MFGLKRKKKNSGENSSTLRIDLRKGEDGFFVAECPQLPGCMSQGATEQEAMENVVDAIRACLEVRFKQFLKESPDTRSSGGGGIVASKSVRVKTPELELVSV